MIGIVRVKFCEWYDGEFAWWVGCAGWIASWMDVTNMVVGKEWIWMGDGFYWGDGNAIPLCLSASEIGWRTP